MTTVTGAIFSLPFAAEVVVELLGFGLKGKFGVINDFPYDVLLGMDFLSETPFLLDFSRGLLVNLGPSDFHFTQSYDILPYNKAQQRSFSPKSLEIASKKQESQRQSSELLTCAGNSAV